MKRVLLTMEHYKPRLFVIGLLFALPFTMGSGCSIDSDLEDGPVPFEVLRAVPGPPSADGQQSVISCGFNLSNIDMDSVNSNQGLSGLELLIDTPQGFTKYLTCADTVEVNFEEEFVLAGMTPTQPHCVSVNKQGLELRNNRLMYKVEILPLECAKPESASYIVKVVSKDYLNYPVSFNIYMEE